MCIVVVAGVIFGMTIIVVIVTSGIAVVVIVCKGINIIHTAWWQVGVILHHMTYR